MASRLQNMPALEYAVDASRLLCPEAYRASDDETFGSIVYRRVEGEKAIEHLFWGPYLPLPAGVYILTFNGELRGRLTIEFAAKSGGLRLSSAIVEDFARSLCFVLRRAVDDFEIRGVTTPALHFLRLDSVLLRCVYASEGDNGR